MARYLSGKRVNLMRVEMRDAGKLAATTPIGRALLGHAKGEIVEAKVPSGVLKFKILDISL